MINVDKHTALCWLLIGLGVYTILPFLYLARFNQPSADDFALAIRDSSYTLEVVLEDVYNNWSGRYLAPVFSRLNPLIYFPSGYRVFPIILILGFVFSSIILFRELLRPRYSSIEVLALTSLFVHLIFSQTPSISEAFYWFSGSCIYQTANIFTLLLIAVLVRLNKISNTVSKILLTVLGALLIFLIIGCNEISMIIVGFILLGVTIKGYKNQTSNNRYNIFLLVACCVCGLVVVLAPGNLSRIDDPAYSNKSFLWTFVGAGALTYLYILKWGVSLLCASVVYFLFFAKTVQGLTSLRGGDVAIKTSVLYFVSVLVVLQFVIIYIAGGGNLGRIENNVYLFVLIGYFFNLHLFIQKFLLHNMARIRENSVLTVFSICFILFNAFDIENNTSSAYVDLISGRANTYQVEMEERLKLATKSAKDTCYVPALSVTPKSLFVTDIRLPTDTTALWINNSYAEYHETCLLFPLESLPLVEPNIEIIRHLGKQVRKNIVPNK